MAFTPENRSGTGGPGPHPESINTRILTEIRSDAPPATIDILAARIGSTYQTVAPRISTLIKRGKLKAVECPWRKELAALNDANREMTVSDIISELQRPTTSSQRASVLKQLYDILQQRGTVGSDFEPGDDRAMETELSRQMRACGAFITRRALHHAFPASQIQLDTINDPSDPTAEAATLPEDLGDAPSGSGMD